MLLDEFGSRTEAADVAGVVAEQLARYVRGPTKPPLEVIARLCAAKGASIDWLWGGEGSREPLDRSRYVHLPLVDPRRHVNIDGGSEFEGANVVDHVDFPRLLIVGVRVSPSDASLCLMLNSGSALEPDIRDGAYLVVDRSVSRVIDDGFYAVGREGDVLFRFIERDFGGGVVVRGRNTDFQTRTLTRGEAEGLRILGRVIWAGALV